MKVNDSETRLSSHCHLVRNQSLESSSEKDLEVNKIARLLLDNQIRRTVKGLNRLLVNIIIAFMWGKRDKTYTAHIRPKSEYVAPVW